jgi:DNA/RNA-binding domain of Phe-tRNA-synthetase-like protein
MNITINPDTLKKIRGIKLGILQASKIDLTSDKPDFEQEFSEIRTFLQSKFHGSRPAEDEIVSHVRRMYRRVGWEPTRYRPSSEALIRRILQGKDLYRINIAVDMANLVSARSRLSMGLYDTAKISGKIILDTGREGESYQGISRPLIHAHNKLILRDDEGIFGNPTADSLRTSLTDKTQDILAVFFCPFEVSNNHLYESLNLLEKYYRQFSTITSREILSYEA